MTLPINLEDRLAREAAEEDALDGVLEDFKDMRELKNERAGLVAREADAAREGFEAGDRDGLAGFIENEVLEFEDLAGFLLDLHVVVVAMVANSQLLLGDCGGL